MTWYDDERFWSALREEIFDAGRFASAETEVAALLRLTRSIPGAAVLDIPCGPGRHLVQLAARGFRVTGVDLSAGYLRGARSQLDRQRLDADLVRADMREFVRPARFDLALNLYTSFGYFRDRRDDARVLRNLHASLRTRGRLVLELLTRETVQSSGGTDRRPDPGGSGGHLTHTWCVLHDGCLLERRFILEHGRKRREFVARHRLYSIRELSALLRQAGFCRIAAYGGFDGRALTSEATYAVLIAQRS